MSSQTVQQVIGRAAIEPEFRALLFRDPTQALASYELTETEAASLRALSPESFDSAVSDLEQRVSRSVVNGINHSGSNSIDYNGNASDSASVTASH